MPIPPEFNGNLALWFNDVVGRLSRANTKLELFREDWATLPSNIKMFIQDQTVNGITAQIVQLEAIKVEIAAIPK